MEFTIKRDVFLEAIQKTLSIAEKKTTNPIFNNILISTEGDRIKIVATDREITLVARYECEVINEGEIALLSRKLYELVRECQGEVVHVSIGDNNIARISCDRAVFKMYGLSAENYPTPNLDDVSQPALTVATDIIKELITNTHYAVSTDETRKNLQGVYFHYFVEDDANWLVMVGTDGNRLAFMRRAISGSGDWSMLEKGIIIHKRGLMEIRRQLEGASGELSLWVDSGAIIIKKGSTTLRVSLIAEQYPNYRKVIPTEWQGTIAFNKEVVLHALRRMGVLASDDSNGVIISLQGDLMTLSSANQELGEAKEELEVKYDGPDVDMNFNVNYLIAAIEVVKGEGALFRLSAQKKANVITAADSDDYMGLVMQLRSK